ISLGSSVPSPEPRFYSPDGSKRPFKTHRSFVPNREGFLQRAVSKAPRPDHPPTPESLICRGASDTVLGVLGNSSGLVALCIRSVWLAIQTAPPPTSRRPVEAAPSRVDPRRLVTNRLHILNVRSRINARMAILPALPSQLQHPRAQPPQEHAVVRHEDHRAFEVLQRIHQHLLGGHVQVIGRLVEH